jgi:hypothetical protein
MSTATANALTFTCENDHPRIVHGEFHCPLCAEIEDHAATSAHLEIALATVAELGAAELTGADIDRMLS